jgi:hypothetical protein
VKRLFGDRIISRNANIAWPPRSPDLSVCDYFLWGHLKSVLYQSRPTNLAQLKTQIEENNRQHSGEHIAPRYAKSSESTY